MVTVGNLGNECAEHAAALGTHSRSPLTTTLSLVGIIIILMYLRVLMAVANLNEILERLQRVRLESVPLSLVRSERCFHHRVLRVCYVFHVHLGCSVSCCSQLFPFWVPRNGQTFFIRIYCTES